MDCAHGSASDALHSPWRSLSMSLPRMRFGGLMKHRFHWRAGIQETVLPACPATSVQHMLPASAQPPSLPWQGPVPVMMLLQILEIKLQLTSMRSDLVQHRVILKMPFASSSWTTGFPGIISLPLPALEVEMSYCLFVVL